MLSYGKVDDNVVWVMGFRICEEWRFVDDRGNGGFVRVEWV